MVFLSLWIDKGIGLIVAGFVPSPVGAVTEYAPSLPEALIALAIWAAGSLILTVLYKIALSVREQPVLSPAGAARSGASMKPRLNEDWLAVWLGLFDFRVVTGHFLRRGLLGWAVTTSVWTSPWKSLAPASKTYGLSGARLAAADVCVPAGRHRHRCPVARPAAQTIRRRVSRPSSPLPIFPGFVGSWAYIAATPDKRAAFHIGWSMNLTNEAGFIVALLVGLVVGNFFPALAGAMKDAIRPELYIKTAIVILGGFLGVTAAEQLGLATSVMFRGICAIVEAYLIYWAVVYYIARRYFRFSREWSAAARLRHFHLRRLGGHRHRLRHRARPVVPVMVSSLVVVFAVMELLLLPFLAQTFLSGEPMVAGAWMGLAVKTDGAAVTSGAVADALIRAKALADFGIEYKPGWIMGVTTTVKVFIDVFIGIWAFVLAWIWSAKIDPKRGEKVKAIEIWERFPKFVLGYIATFGFVLAIGLLAPALVPKAKAAMSQANVFRGIFFVMTFFTIGVVSDFRKLWQEGIGRLALVYVLCLFGFIIWIGLAISWIFFHGVKPPVV